LCLGWGGEEEEEEQEKEKEQEEFLFIDTVHPGPRVPVKG